jgi:hypothetical protein
MGIRNLWVMINLKTTSAALFQPLPDNTPENFNEYADLERV